MVEDFLFISTFSISSRALVVALGHLLYMEEKEEFSRRNKGCRKRKEEKVEEYQRKDKKVGKEKKRIRAR